MTEDWGPWVRHDQSGFPKDLRVGMYIALRIHHPNFGLKTCEGFLLPGDDKKTCWWSKRAGVWIEYRIRKPRALTALQEMIADLPVEEPA